MRLPDWIDAFRPADGPPPTTLYAFMVWCLRGSFLYLAIWAAFSALLGTMEVVAALLLGRVIDSAIDTGPTQFFDENIGLMIGVVVFFLAVRPASFAISAALNSIVVQPNVNPLVLSRLHRWTLGQSVTFFDNDFAGRIAQKQMQSSRAVTDVVVETVNTLFFAFASFVGGILLLTTIDWRVAALLGVWVLAYAVMITWYLPRIRQRSKARAAARAMVSGQVVDTITNIKTVKLFAHNKYEDQAALGSMQTFREAVIAVGYLSTGFRAVLMLLAGCLPVLLIGATLWLWSNGQATPGGIAAAGAVAIRFAQMTGWVSFTLMGIYANIGEVEDGMRTLTPPHALTDSKDAGDLPKVEGEIVFEDIGFAYGREKGGVEGINLTVRPGEKIGVVGASGAGKSTLVSLLLRLYDTEKGAIRIDGIDIREVTQESLRRQIGMVTQDTAMFNRSARDNLAYGKPDASDEEIVAAARKAEADRFIQDLVDFKGRTGYDAHLGERGVRLSGGQRQRVALARAILKDAPILVLDEATSALDSEVEAQIQEALDRVIEDKTVLAIAHRLSTIAKMDRIIVLDEGRIVEEGSHADLLAKDGLYAGYWRRQSGGFLDLTQAAE